MFCSSQNQGAKLTLKTSNCAGECWPGPVVFPDFTRKEVREWWAGLVKKFAGNGVDGIWNDMNEPAVFKVTDDTLLVVVFGSHLRLVMNLNICIIEYRRVG